MEEEVSFGDESPAEESMSMDDSSKELEENLKEDTSSVSEAEVASGADIQAETAQNAPAEISVARTGQKRLTRKKDWTLVEGRKLSLRPRKVVETPEASPAKKVKSKQAGETSSGSEKPSDSPPHNESTYRRRSKRWLAKKNSDESKEERISIPSPSLPEGQEMAAGPESSLTPVDQLERRLVCLCLKKPRVFVPSNQISGDFKCQALSAVDDKIFGCCNSIPSATIGLRTPGVRVKYSMLCSTHLQLLYRHMCCPGCGFFMLQGPALKCRLDHFYHEMCSEQGCCLHCGDSSQPMTVKMFMQSARNPVFLANPRSFRGTKPAKIAVEPKVSLVKVEPLPVTVPMELLQYSPSPDPSDPEKLVSLLGVACSSLGALSSRHPTSHRYTPKHLLAAVTAGDGKKLLKIMSSGFNPNCILPEMKCQTVLHVAAEMGDTLLVHLLVQAGLSMDVLDNELNTPLSLAIVARQEAVVKYLVKAGASLLLRNAGGMTPLHLAAKHGNLEASAILLSAPNLPHRYVDDRDDGGWTPLVWAAEYNQLAVAKLLLSEGSDPAIPDVEHNIALHWAAFGGSLEVVELLLAHGCDESAINALGDSPLHVAARQGKLDCVMLLISRGADCNIKNKNGETAKDCAPLGSEIYGTLHLNELITEKMARFLTRGPRIVSNDLSNGKERNPIQCVNSVDDEPMPSNFVYVTENVFTSQISINRSVDIMHHCNCDSNSSCTGADCTCTHLERRRTWYDEEGKLSEDFNYNEPSMILECNPLCGCNRRLCRNRVLQNGSTCRFQLFRTEECGWGLKTLGLIKKGSFVCEYVGEIINDQEAEQREDDSYIFDLEPKGEDTFCIDACKYGNISRFINHHCEPNVTPVNVFADHHDLIFPRIAFFANQDIQPDTELGYNYGERFWDIKSKTFTCKCQAPRCMFSDDTIENTLDLYRKKIMKDNC